MYHVYKTNLGILNAFVKKVIDPSNQNANLENIHLWTKHHIIILQTIIMVMKHKKNTVSEKYTAQIKS